MKKTVWELVLNSIVVALVLISIVAQFIGGFSGQLWYFTLQTNIFIMLVAVVIIVVDSMSLKHKTVKFVTSRWFCLIRLLTTFFITITGVVYCFVLAPISIVVEHLSFWLVFNFTNVFLHICVPIISIVCYLLFGTHGQIKYSDAFYFLIYPLLYLLLVNVRVWCGGGNTLLNNAKYPYFFIDPTYHNQGWRVVWIYVAGLIVAFYLLALLYIFLDKKLAQRKANKTKSAG